MNLVQTSGYTQQNMLPCFSGKLMCYGTLVRRALIGLLLGVSGLQAGAVEFDMDALVAMEDEGTPAFRDVEQVCLSPEDVKNLICAANGECDLFAHLSQDLFLRTNPVNAVRSLLDIPSLWPYYFYNECGQFTAQLFYNVMPKAFLTCNSPYIPSYIDFSDVGPIGKIVNAYCAGRGDVDCRTSGIADIFSSLANIHLTQHRTGFIFGFSKEYACCNMSIRLPLYYFLNHFYLNTADQEALRENLAALGIDSFDQSNVMQFAFDHLVSDAVGIDDTRVAAVYKFWDGRCTESWFGVQLTLPTGVAFKRGMLGRDFSCLKTQPFDIYTSMNECFCGSEFDLEKLKASALAYGLGTLDQFSAMLIEPQMGNGGHVGVGPQWDFKYTMSECWMAHTEAIFEYLFAADERRYFLRKKDADAFIKVSENCLTLPPAEVIGFVNVQVENTVRTVPTQVSVRPGWLIKLRQSFAYDHGDFHGSIGADYWYQGAELLKPSQDFANQFWVSKATRSAAQQIKVYGDIGYWRDAACEGTSWYGLLTFDGTVFNKGIGKDLTVGVRFGVEF